MKQTNVEYTCISKHIEGEVKRPNNKVIIEN